MRAWFLEKTCNLENDSSPLRLKEVDVPIPCDNEMLIQVVCCGICHTELDEIEGRLDVPHYPVVPGHQVVGIVRQNGKQAKRFEVGKRVGVAWIGGACGGCEYCLRGLENLCSEFKGTGRDVNGGYAEYMVVNEKFAFEIPDELTNYFAAPLLCAGAIGYRALMLAGCGNGYTLGLSGFGASGHLVLKMARILYSALKIQVFARNVEDRQFAIGLGADWAGDFHEQTAEPMNAIIDTTPAWSTILDSLSMLKPGGRLVINAIRKESDDISSLTNLVYENHLWHEKEIKSVANITRRDVSEFLTLAAKHSILPEIYVYDFEDANRALMDLKLNRVKGAKVLRVSI